jgi:APA family basic amino acid/polyamine antiporter
MIGGVLTVMAVYLLVNLAFLHALTLDQLAASTLPAADAVRHIFGETSGQLITVLALLTLASLANAQMLVSPRILFAMGRDSGSAPAITRVNTGGTPASALAVLLVVSTLLVVTGTYERLLGITTFLFVLSYGSGFLAVFALRWKEPRLARPYRLWGYPWTTLIVLGGSLAFLVAVIASDTRNSLYAAALIGVSAPLYWLIKR